MSATQRQTSARVRLLTQAAIKAVFGRIEVRGKENLYKIPSNAKVVIATTHISDFDVGMPAAILGRMFRIRAANLSMQHYFWRDPVNNMILRILGKKSAFPVDFLFNPKNFAPMREALENGDAIAIAAYNPQRIKDGKLPLVGGYGAVYLAQISGAAVVPVAINIQSDDPLIATTKHLLATLKERPEAEMLIGEPYFPEKIEGLEEFDLRTVSPGLRRESNQLMRRLAQLLPEKKRGKWQEKLVTTPPLPPS